MPILAATFTAIRHCLLAYISSILSKSVYLRFCCKSFSLFTITLLIATNTMQVPNIMTKMLAILE
jgi:hypothetical protein